MSVYAHRHARMYIHICILTQGRNLIGQEIQRIKPIVLMHLSWHSNLGDQPLLPGTSQRHLLLHLLENLVIIGKGKESNSNSTLPFNFNEGSRAIFRLPTASVAPGVFAVDTRPVLLQLEM